MSFSNFASFVSKVTIEVMRNFFECIPRIVTLQNYVMNASLYAVFILQSKSKHFTRGSQTMDIFGTSIVTFETEVANFENDIASEKWP